MAQNSAWSRDYFTSEKDGTTHLTQRLFAPAEVPPQHSYMGHSPRIRQLSDEEPKVALSRRINPLKFLIHLVALGTTAAVLQLSFRGVYWFDTGKWSTEWYFLYMSQDEVTNALQFAAKLNEILIVGSLTAMVMHFVRRRLVGRGLPFGLLTSGYQASSVEFLFSKSFWATALHGEFWLVISLALVIVFSNMIGPSTAIAIIPTLDWWPLANPFDDRALTTYFLGTSDGLYRKHIKMDPNYNYNDCSTLNYTYNILCPGSGFTDLLGWAEEYANENAGANMSMSEPIGGKRRQLISQNMTSSTDGTPGVVVATTLYQNLVRLTGQFWNYVYVNPVGEINNVARPLLIPSDDSVALAPLVQVQCNFYDYNDSLTHTYTAIDGLTYPTDLLNFFDMQMPPSMIGIQVDQSLYNFSRPTNITNFTWVEISSFNETTSSSNGASLAALVTLPYLISLSEDSSSANTAQASAILPCTIDARWIAVDMSLDPSNNDLVQSNVTNPMMFANQYFWGNIADEGTTIGQQPIYGISDAITIDPEWAEMLNVADVVPSEDISTQRNFTMMETLFQPFMNNGTFNGSSRYLANDTKWLSFYPPYYNGWVNGSDGLDVAAADAVATIIAMVISEGLSRNSYAASASVIKTDNDPSNATVLALAAQAGAKQGTIYFPSTEDLYSSPSFNFTVQRYGYGYSWNYSTTVEFGVFVLVIYWAIGLAYMIYSLSFWASRGGDANLKGWASSAWGGTGEMVALALVSSKAGPRAALGAVGVSVDETSTWRRRTRIQEGPDGTLELVVSSSTKLGWEDAFDDGADITVGKKYQ